MFVAAHDLDEQVQSPDYRWTIGVPDNAPYTVNHMQDSWGVDDHGDAVALAALSISGKTCDDDTRAPLWITVSDPSGRTLASITAQVRIMCGDIPTANT